MPSVGPATGSRFGSSSRNDTSNTPVTPACASPPPGAAAQTRAAPGSRGISGTGYVYKRSQIPVHRSYRVPSREQSSSDLMPAAHWKPPPMYSPRHRAPHRACARPRFIACGTTGDSAEPPATAAWCVPCDAPTVCSAVNPGSIGSHLTNDMGSSVPVCHGSMSWYPQQGQPSALTHTQFGMQSPGPHMST